MPTYQYACTECGEPLEVVQSFTDDALTDCPSCGGRLRKRFNAVGIVFKGSGFYRTDSRSSSSGSESAVPAGSAAAKGSDNGAKAEGAAPGGSAGGVTTGDGSGSGGGEGKKTAPAASSPGGSSDTSAA